MTAKLRISLLGGSAGVLGLALCALATRASARTDELARSAGEAMLTYAAAEHVDQPRRISLNGAELHVLSGSTRDDLRSLLDVFEARCVRGSGGGGGVAQFLEPFGNRWLQRVAGLGHVRLDGVLRSDDGERGYVACFDLGGEALEASELIAKLRAFTASGDLSTIGGLRFVWAQREGAATAYVALWSEGALPLYTMFPAHGDAPGVDLPDVPRPRAARRLLSAWQEQLAPLLVSYRADALPAVLEAAYRAQLRASGFDVQPAPTGLSESRVWLLRRGQALAIAVIDGDEHGGSLLTLSALR